MRVFVTTLVLGITAGVLLDRWLAAEPGHPQVTATERGMASVDARSTTRSNAPDPEVRRLRAEVGRLRETADALEVEAHGIPVPWPDDTPRALREDFDTTLDATLAACGSDVRNVHTDCTEPPCRAHFRTNDPSELLEVALECPEWIERYGLGFSFDGFAAACGDDRAEQVLVIGPESPILTPPDAPEDNERLRSRVRTKAVKSTWKCGPPSDSPSASRPR